MGKMELEGGETSSGRKRDWVVGAIRDEL